MIPVQRTCEYCGSALQRRQTEGAVAWQARRFCSRVCSVRKRWNLSLAGFWSRVDPQPNGCLEWTGARDRLGYGQVTSGRKSLKAHRVALELETAQEIPEGMVVCHACDNPPCINPEHLFIGTQGDNIRDAVGKGRLLGPPPRFGNANHRTVLTDDDVDEIRRRYVKGRRPESGSGSSASELATEFGVTPAHIWDLCNNDIRRVG